MDDDISGCLAGIMGKNETRVLLFLKQKGPSFSVEIERGADLRQPEASVATRHLLEKEFIEMEKIENDVGRGRPKNRYSLRPNVKERLLSIVEEKISHYQKMKKSIEKEF